MTTDKGVILKTLRNINPGEPLLMWFAENILAMLDIPFLKPYNIQGETLIFKRNLKTDKLHKLFIFVQSCNVILK